MRTEVGWRSNQQPDLDPSWIRSMMTLSAGKQALQDVVHVPKLTCLSVFTCT